MAQHSLITGHHGIMIELDLVTKRMAKGWEDGMERAGEYLLRKSQEIVPVDTGTLKASGYTLTWGYGFDAKFTVGYSAPYAVYVHEDLLAKHKPGQYAKFLERPLADPRVRKYMFTLIYRAQK